MNRFVTLFGRPLFFIFLIAVGTVLIGFVSAQAVQENQDPPTIKSPSSVGDVAFPHQSHYEDLEIECVTCHHDINAASLIMPHEDYFDDFWIDCKICHRGDGSAVSQPQSCSNCHHDSPTDIADETLSTKVVVHKKCWECHELEKGEKASQSCSVCHLNNPDKMVALGLQAGLLKKGGN